MAAPPAPLNRELLIFCGKGGVGKTTTSAVAALATAHAGRRTLLVTIDPARRLGDALGVPVSHRVKPVRGKLHAMMLDPEKVVDETLRLLYPDHDLTKHPFYKYISNYMPGLNEVIAIGQLSELRRERDFETIVVDTPPTGDALSFLTTPMKVRDLFRENLFVRMAVRGYGVVQKLSRGGRVLKGLLGSKGDIPPVPEVDFEKLLRDLSQHVGDIHELLQDPRRTAMFLVTNPERLAVAETMDLHEYITKTLQIHVAALVVNKVAPDALGATSKAFHRFLVDVDARRAVAASLDRQGYPAGLLQKLVDAAQYASERRGSHLEHLADLDRRLPKTPQIPLPLMRQDIQGLDALTELVPPLLAALQPRVTVGS